MPLGSKESRRLASHQDTTARTTPMTRLAMLSTLPAEPIPSPIHLLDRGAARRRSRRPNVEASIVIIIWTRFSALLSASIGGAKDSMEALGNAAPGTRLRHESSPLNFSTTTASFGAGRPLPRDNGDAGDAGDAGRGSGAVHSLVDTARAPRGRKPRRLVRCIA